MNIKDALGYLGGGFVVYTIMIACSQGLGGSSDSGAGGSANGGGNSGFAGSSPVPDANAGPFDDPPTPCKQWETRVSAYAVDDWQDTTLQHESEWEPFAGHTIYRSGTSDSKYIFLRRCLD